MLFRLLILSFSCEQTWGGVLRSLAPETPKELIHFYDIPTTPLQLDPIKQGSPSETHGQQNQKKTNDRPKEENPPYPPIPASFHLPQASTKTATFNHPPPLFDTSYSSSITQPLLIEAAPSKNSKVPDASFLIPPKSSAWKEKFEPLSPETKNPKSQPQPLPRLPEQPEIQVDRTQTNPPMLEAVEETIILHHPHHIYFSGSSIDFFSHYYP